jgi:GTP1/Obg family GTP-binding protein
MIGFAILILAAVVFGAMAFARPAPKGHPDYDEYLEIEELRARVEALSCNELVRQRDEAFAERLDALNQLDAVRNELAEAIISRDAFRSEMESLNMASAKALTDVWHHVCPSLGEWDYPAQAARMIIENYDEAKRIGAP